MLRKILCLALAAAAVTLFTTTRAQAWGAYHVGYTHVGPGGVQHYGRTVGYGANGAFSAGHASAYGAYGGAYRAGGYRYASPYGGYDAGGFRAAGYGGAYGAAGVYRRW